MASSSLAQGGTMSASSLVSPTASPSVDTDSRLADQLDSYHRSGHSTPSPSGDIEYPRVVNGKLIESSPPHLFRSVRLPPLLPANKLAFGHTPTGSAILPPTDTPYTDSPQKNVSKRVLDPTAAYHNYSPRTQHVYEPSTPLESEYPDFTHDVSLNQQSPRPPTSPQVFSRLPDLAAHYGIPQLLPPAPRPTPRRPSFSSSPSTSTSQEEFNQVCSNYLTMLSRKPEDTMIEDAAVPAPSADMLSTVFGDEAIQSVYEVLSASPEFMTSPDFTTSPEYPMSEFLTSPFEDSPLDDMLTTPALGSTDLDMLTSPLLADMGDLSDMNLFGGLFEPFNINDSKPAPLPQLDNLYTLPSPVTPSLDPSSLYASPRQPSTPSFPTSSTRRKVSATGTRKNITPESLVPLDAPTQPRKYTVPSATSRKDMPAIFARKRGRSQAFGDEDDLPEEPLPPNATEREQIEWKRRQNTLAARKSRKRKLLHQLELEATVERLAAEKETWRIRALTFQALLKNNGHEVPEFS